MRLTRKKLVVENLVTRHAQKQRKGSGRYGACYWMMFRSFLPVLVKLSYGIELTIAESTNRQHGNR